MFSESASSGKAIEKQGWVFLGFLWVAFLINNVHRQAVYSIFPVLSNQLHFSRVQLGLVGSIFIWTYCSSNPLMGRLADVIRRDRLVTTSVMLWSLATVGTALSTSVGSFLAWRAFLALMESLYMPAALGLIAAWHSGRTRSTALAIHSSAQYTGYAVGGWFGGMAAETIGWREGFLVLAAIGILYAILLSVVFRPKTPQPLEAKLVSASPLAVFRSNCFVALLVARVVFSAMLWVFFAWLPTFVFTKYHLSLAKSGLTGTAYLQAGAVVGVLAWGLVADFICRRVRSGRFYVIAFDMLCCVPCALLILNVNSVESLKLASVGFGFFASGLTANVVAAAFDVVSVKNYGLVVGLINLVEGLGGGASVLLIGWTNKPNGMQEAMVWMAIAVVAAAIALAAVSASRYQRDRDFALLDIKR